MDKGLRRDGISDWLLQLHSLNNYINEHILHELRLERQRALILGTTRPMFSKFDDWKKYNGAVHSGKFLAQVYKKEVEDIRPHMDREMKKVSLDQFSIDANAKSPEKLTQHSGK